MNSLTNCINSKPADTVRILNPSVLVALFMVLHTSACTQSINGGSPSAATLASNQSLAIEEECKLLNNAMETIALETGERDLQIVRGCPGFENITDTSPRFDNSDGFPRALRVSLPNGAAASGPIARRIYQKMIIRKIPREIADQQARTPQFLVAVNAATDSQP